MSDVGAVILTAGNKSEGLDSMYVVEGQTLLSGIIDMLEELQVDPVTIVLGDRKDIIEKHFHGRNIRTVFNPSFDHESMLESIKLGINDIRRQCDRILIIRPDIPAFSVNTIKEMLSLDRPLVRPVYQDKPGNPVLIGSEYFNTLISYNGEGGMQGAFDSNGIGFYDYNVDDPGVLINSNDLDDFERIREIKAKAKNKGLPYSAAIDLKFRSISPFFTNESAILLEIIDDTHSIKTACDCMHISYSKAWTMIRSIEKETGIRFVIKKIGGFKGGNTHLTEEGRDFVREYRAMMKMLQYITEEMFNKSFSRFINPGNPVTEDQPEHQPEDRQDHQPEDRPTDEQQDQ